MLLWPAAASSILWRCCNAARTHIRTQVVQEHSRAHGDQLEGDGEHGHEAVDTNGRRSLFGWVGGKSERADGDGDGPRQLDPESEEEEEARAAGKDPPKAIKV